jgi:hypothetical protein
VVNILCHRYQNKELVHLRTMAYCLHSCVLLLSNDNTECEMKLVHLHRRDLMLTYDVVAAVVLSPLPLRVGRYKNNKACVLAHKWLRIAHVLAHEWLMNSSCACARWLLDSLCACALSSCIVHLHTRALSSTSVAVVAMLMHVRLRMMAMLLRSRMRGHLNFRCCLL